MCQRFEDNSEYHEQTANAMRNENEEGTSKKRSDVCTEEALCVICEREVSVGWRLLTVNLFV